MEFDIDSDNIQIIVKNKKNEQNDSGVSPRSDSDIFDLSANNTIKYEVLLKLEDYYLINNIKLNLYQFGMFFKYVNILNKICKLFCSLFLR